MCASAYRRRCSFSRTDLIRSRTSLTCPAFRDLAGPVRLLHPDAVYVTDGGGGVAAMRKPVYGGERVAEVMVRVGRQWRPDRIDLVEVGGELALVCHREGRVYSVDTLQITDGLISAYRRVINPDKLSHV
ncbi:sigma-70 family RNA polymerase sigma factor family protein [Nonomuraea cypriaca]|uniref:hypothetical protein n=1 Tax=Nonomuraea cypriaca TaxID=1187855 RepID=UPI001A9C3C1D|nr:hypothetical protein [Nonomuraea cypriaca]